MADNCIFCRIIKGEIPSTKVYEDENVIAFKDINPAAPVHVLVVPKQHIDSLEALNEENIQVVAPVHKAIQEVAKITGVAEQGYRVIVNCGPGAGQTVMHLHYHVLGGVKMGEKIL
ncbi:MAG: histidine triad nucleotide-binding protein [Clostridiaceae bacterium]|jgi:histidine triad (HIT) family protein|nr:histidine triad nucleotide-binding protein [Clostridiaceae bacterium]